MDLYSLSEAAEKLGVHKSTVSRACAKHGIGTPVGRAIVLTLADLRQLRKVVPGKVGNPNFKPGNYFGKPRRPRKKS